MCPEGREPVGVRVEAAGGQQKHQMLRRGGVAAG